MRETFFLGGKRRYAEDFAVIQAAIEKVYPGSERYGSTCAWHWESGGRIVAEAWTAPRKPGWYFKISKHE